MFCVEEASISTGSGGESCSSVMPKFVLCLSELNCRYLAQNSKLHRVIDQLKSISISSVHEESSSVGMSFFFMIASFREMIFEIIGAFYGQY